MVFSSILQNDGPKAKNFLGKRETKHHATKGIMKDHQNGNSTSHATYSIPNYKTVLAFLDT
jgi:hypothetical protein